MTTAMTADQPAEEIPFYLRGNFAPVTEEVTAFDLSVDGAIPPEISGLYLRNGPNPKTGVDPRHWFFGDGMLHGVRIAGGQARWYRNRWVRTRAFTEGALVIDGEGNIDRTAGIANTGVIGHAGRILALVENAYPVQVTSNLDTIGPCDFDGRLRTAMTAHPKLCPHTGELHFFGYSFFPPFLVYHRLDANGALVQSEEIEVRGPSMMHDFAITDRHVVFMDLPIVFNLDRVFEGAMPYEWNDDYGARLGVMPRGGRGGDVRWFDIDPCYVFHPFNAYERDGAIVVDVARYPELWRGQVGTFTSAYAHRWTIDLAGGGVREQPLDDQAIEFPRIDDRRNGLSYRYAYAVADFNERGDRQQNLIKYDLDRGTSVVHQFAADCAAGEGLFVPAGSGEDEGYVMAFVYDRGRDASDLVILDASSFAAPPLATIHLPQRVPFGFHGTWLADG